MMDTQTAQNEWTFTTYSDAFLDSVKENITREIENQDEQKVMLQSLETRWQNFNWDNAAKRYKRHMQQIFGYVRVIGTTEPIPIGDIFTDVYILEKPQAYRRFDLMKLQELQKEPQKLTDGKRERGLKVVLSKEGHRLYILGKPGAGKTTFLKYLIHQTIVADELNKLPIFVTLRDWNANDTNLLDFIAKQFDVCSFPDAKPFINYLLDSGRAIALFDGLDEVPTENHQRDKTIQALHDFSKKYLKTQIIITCRVAANDYSFTEFTYIELADFSEAQVMAYAINWFRNDQHTAVEFVKELSLSENRGLRELGRSPLLLSMICLAYEEILTIPKRRVELYQEALDALLKKWDASRKIYRSQNENVLYKNLSLGRKKQMFARIATEYFERGEIYFPKKDIANKIETFISHLPLGEDNEQVDGETILENITAQHGIFVERAKSIYSFSHLTFQEYFTAKYISDNALHGTLDKLCTHINNLRWKEIFLLVASLLDDATTFFDIYTKAMNKTILSDDYLTSFFSSLDNKKDAKKKLDATQASQNRVQHLYEELRKTRDDMVRNNVSKQQIETFDLNLSLLETISLRLGSKKVSKAKSVQPSTEIIYDELNSTLKKLSDLVLKITLSKLREKSINKKDSTVIDIYKTIGLEDKHLSKMDPNAFEQIRTYNDQIKSFSQKITVPSIKSKIHKLKIPNTTDDLHAWEKTHKTLQELEFDVKLNFKSWFFSKDQQKKINLYIQANVMLLDCLSVAALPYRETVINRLLNVNFIAD